MRSMTGKNGAILLIIMMASSFWIMEALRWSIGYSKYPGMYLSDNLYVVWILCTLGSPLLSLLLAFLIIADRREVFAGGFFAAFFYGCSPLLLLFWYLLITL